MSRVSPNGSGNNEVTKSKSYQQTEALPLLPLLCDAPTSIHHGKRIILDLCGGSGNWSHPYVEAGYDVRLIDLPTDVRLLHLPDFDVWGILAAPPCTHLSNAGASTWKRKGEDILRDALSVVDACLRLVLLCKPKWWALENPVGRLVHYIGRPKMIYQPYEYGDAWTKKSCLWGDFNTEIPKLVVEPKMRVMGASKSKNANGVYRLPEMRSAGRNRQAMRSLTSPGFARAFFEANP